jgi:hypothetical protein
MSGGRHIQPGPHWVGLDVHYVSAGSADGRYPSVCRAAKIVDVPLVRVDDYTDKWGNPTLIVFNPKGIHFPEDVPFHAGFGAMKPYTWHWMPHNEYPDARMS